MNVKYAVNTLQLNIKDLTLYYSYETIIGFHTTYDGLIVCENIWSNTTGKYLNSICPDKKRRLPYTEFLTRLEAVQRKYNLI